MSSPLPRDLPAGRLSREARVVSTISDHRTPPCRTGEIDANLLVNTTRDWMPANPMPNIVKSGGVWDHAAVTILAGWRPVAPQF